MWLAISFVNAGTKISLQWHTAKFAMALEMKIHPKFGTMWHVAQVDFYLQHLQFILGKVTGPDIESSHKNVYFSLLSAQHASRGLKMC